jgi:hypothetical protein
VDATVRVPTSATGGETDVAAITLTSQSGNAQLATARLTTTANTIYGVMMEPATDAQSGGPGEAVNYTLQVTNTGNVTDTFDVTVSDHTWPITTPTTLGPLAAGASASVVATVSIPTSTGDGVTDTATVIVTSQGDNAQSATATLTTVTEAFKPPSDNLFLPLIMK